MNIHINQKHTLSIACISIIVSGAFTLSNAIAAPTADEMWQVIQEQQKTIETLQQELAGRDKQAEAGREGDTVPALHNLEKRVADNEARLEASAAGKQRNNSNDKGWWNHTDVSGYGSARFEASNLNSHNSGFTQRRLILEVKSKLMDRLQTYFELEFERFTKLELEKGSETGTDNLKLSQAIEGSNESEISLEQAWARYAFTPELRFEIGALLVPVGRFNIHQDDNRWVLPRRTLVDRGAPVLPVAVAWTELGAGVTGTSSIGDFRIDYRFYAMNGATLDFAFENELEVAAEAGKDAELASVTKVELGPSRGPFDMNANDSLAFAGRLGLRQEAGHELALSGYIGNYVPSFLGRDENVWSFAIDGVHHVGGFEFEYEVATTHFDGLQDVAGAFAVQALAKEREISGVVENGAFGVHKIEFALSSNIMARNKTGYWIEIRRPFHVNLLKDTIFGYGFSDQMLIPVFRMEQVFFNDLLQGIEFDGAALTAYRTRDASVNRATLGLGYRPVPGWVIQLAGEYTWTGEDSLAGLTNYLPAGPSENDNFSLLLGLAFGF